MSDSRVDKWREWIEERIAPEVQTMYLRRDVFHRVAKMIQESELPPSYYWQYMRDTYATTQAIAIRRQADDSKSVISLARLLLDIRADASYMTREAFLEPWPDDDWDRQFAARRFAVEFADASDARLDPAVPSADLEALRDTAASVKTWADKHLAHSDVAQGSTGLPTFNDIDRAVDRIGGLFRKYGDLLTAADYLLPPLLLPDWMEIFRRPWLK